MANEVAAIAQHLRSSNNICAHLNFRDLRKMLKLPTTGPDPQCLHCSACKLKRHPQPKVSAKRSTTQGHRFHLDIFFALGKPWQMVVDCMSRRSWPQKLKSKDECLAKFVLLVVWFYKDKYPLKTAFVRTDAEQQQEVGRILQ